MFLTNSCFKRGHLCYAQVSKLIFGNCSVTVQPYDVGVVRDSHAVDFDEPIGEEQDLAVDTTQIDGL